METVKLKSRNKTVYTLKEILLEVGYDYIIVDNYFDVDTDRAVKDFQKKNKLVVDGIVGIKTWTILLSTQKEIFSKKNKFLSENDLINFAKQYKLELAVVKAVNEIESNGTGFLINGDPKILFEGHIFWKELTKRGIDPKKFSVKNPDILYKTWTKKYYLGGAAEYKRLNKAIALSDNKEVKEAALCATSWGMFQIMGFNAIDIGYKNVESFTADMYKSEGLQLKAFGMYLKKNKLIPFLQKKDWTRFALKYNGPSQASNAYDKKLKKAYDKYSKK